MKTIKFDEKEFVESFVCSTINDFRESSKRVMLDGRWYIKEGTEQAITLVGNIFKVKECDVEKTMLYIGMSKQHPCDSKCDKEIAIEQAQIKAFDDPIMIYEVQRGQSPKYMFYDFANMILGTLDLEFIRTSKEIEKLGLDKHQFNR